MLPETIKMNFFGEGIKEIPSRHVFYATLVGLAVGWLISAITEYFTDIETTDYCVLSCRREGRNFEYRFDRFLDAEVSLIDMIAEE